MSDIRVPPGALRAFAGDCRETAGSLDDIDAASSVAGVDSGLPGTVTAASMKTAAADLRAAYDAVATRHRTMADVADGTQDDDNVTKDEIVTGFGQMSHR